MGDAEPPRRRSARGEHRRGLLLDAAAALLVEQGFAAVSHRAVARRAGLPLAATTYYFATLDELVASAMEQVAGGWLARARALAADLPLPTGDVQQVAAAVLRVAALETAPVGTGAEDPRAAGTATSGVLALYERYLEAARRDDVRPVIARYDAALEHVLADLLHRGGCTVAARSAGLVLAVVDGALLRALAEGASLLSARAPLVELLTALERGLSRARPGGRPPGPAAAPSPAGPSRGRPSAGP